MRTVVHLSDVHFGRVDFRVVAPLVEAVCELRPDLTVVSGDFTQNGTVKEFEQARDFLMQLPQPRITTAGNHDMPFLNFPERLVDGLKLYQRYISQDLDQFWADDELAVMSVVTARRWLLKGGRIHEDQVERIERQLCEFPGNVTKILVTHHPFDLAQSYDRDELVGQARMAMGRLAQSVDVLLAGHMHVSHAGHTAVRYKLRGRSAVFVQAGTATSTRERGEPNAFNVLRIDRPSLVVERWQWRSEQARFDCVCTDRFQLYVEPAVCGVGVEGVREDEVEVEYAG